MDKFEQIDAKWKGGLPPFHALARYFRFYGPIVPIGAQSPPDLRNAAAEIGRLLADQTDGLSESLWELTDDNEARYLAFAMTTDRGDLVGIHAIQFDDSRTAWVGDFVWMAPEHLATARAIAKLVAERPGGKRLLATMRRILRRPAPPRAPYPLAFEPAGRHPEAS